MAGLFSYGYVVLLSDFYLLLMHVQTVGNISYPMGDWAAPGIEYKVDLLSAFFW